MTTSTPGQPNRLSTVASLLYHGNWPHVVYSVINCLVFFASGLVWLFLLGAFGHVCLHVAVVAWHLDRFCERCEIKAPEHDGEAEAEKRQATLKRFHNPPWLLVGPLDALERFLDRTLPDRPAPRNRDRALIVLPVALFVCLLFSLPLFVGALLGPVAAVAASVLLLVGVVRLGVVVNTHNRLAPWCPYCGGGGDDETTETPTPLGDGTKSA